MTALVLKIGTAAMGLEILPTDVDLTGGLPNCARCWRGDVSGDVSPIFWLASLPHGQSLGLAETCFCLPTPREPWNSASYIWDTPFESARGL